MTNYQWVGAASTSASTAANWLPNGSPAAGDVVIFDAAATQNCSWDIATPGGTTLSVDEMILETNFIHQLILTQKPRIKGMFLGGTIAVGGGADSIDFQHGSSPNFFGSYKTYNERFLLIDGGTATGITINMIGSSTPITKFDDGAHPIVRLQTGKFAPDYVVPTSNSGKASFDSFSLVTPAEFAPDGDLVDNDRIKVFSFEEFIITSTSINFGLSTAEYTATVGGFYIPTAGASGMPTGFTNAFYRKIILKANTAGHKCLMSDNTYISVEEFEIGDGVVLKGPVDSVSQGADIRSIKTPKIRGTWSFSQISPGIYRSPRNASGPIPKVNGDFHITGKLDVDGLIDPTGLELNPQSSNPGGVTANTLWLNSTDSNKLYLGSSEVSGGGGSGTVTSVATTAPITGGTITGTGTIGISAATTSAAGSMSGADKTKLDGIETSADVTDAANVTAAGALMDSEVTNLAQVKAFNSADYATAAQGATANTALQTVAVDGVTVIGNGTVANPLVAPPAGGGGSALEFAEYRMVNHNPSTSSSNDFNSNTRWVADLADTNFWTAATTASDHTSIVLHSDGYLTLAANGIYDVWFSTDIFGHGTNAANIDSFVEISTNNSGDRRYATTREVFRINGVQVKYNHQTTAKIRTGGSAVNIYFSAYLNGCGYYLASYNDYRTSVKVIRLGDA